jgi:hypothetical protein
MAQQQMQRGNAMQDYVTVAERIEKFYREHAQGRIITHILEHDSERGFILMRAEVYRNADDAQPAATGHAYEYRDAGFVQKTSYIEVCECVPIDTEILTLNGWKTYDELSVGELVMSYDISQDEMVWTPVQKKSFYPNQPIVRLHNPKGFEVFCTPNHTWAVEYKVAQKRKCYIYRKLRPTNELKKVDGIIGSAPMMIGFMETTPKQAALMGWAITDGWFSRPTANQFRIGIGQSKPNNIQIIRSLVSEMAHSEHTYPAYTRTFPSGRTYDCRESVHWQLASQASRDLLAAFNISHESDLPKVVPQLSFEARAAMLEAMMLGDGTEIGRFGCKNRPWVMDVFAMLCALQGHVALKRQFSSVGEVPLQTIKRTQRIWASSLQQDDAGQADVWCPTVEHGTWVARFSNGVTVLTGNTSAVGRALALCGFEVKRGIASREEMEKQTRHAQNFREKVVTAVKEAGPAKAEKPALEPATAPTAKAERMATDIQKDEILDLLEVVRPNQRPAQKQLLIELTGKQSREELTYQDAIQLIEKLKAESEQAAIEDDPLI